MTKEPNEVYILALAIMKALNVCMVWAIGVTWLAWMWIS